LVNFAAIASAIFCIPTAVAPAGDISTLGDYVLDRLQQAIGSIDFAQVTQHLL
jgi:hypothetical protein